MQFQRLQGYEWHLFTAGHLYLIHCIFFFRYNTSDSTNVDISKFTHLIIEARSKYSKNLRPFFKSHDVIDSIEGFSHLHINYQYFPPFKLKKKPILTILQRKDLFGIRDKQDIDEILDLLTEEETENSDGEESQDGFQLSSRISEITNKIQNATETASVQKITYPSADSTDNTHNKKLNESGAIESEESVIKSPKLLVNPNKTKQISQMVPNRSQQESEQIDTPTDSTKDGVFLGESDEIPLVTAAKSNSRINKSAMKIIRSKTNNLAFDALQDALREEEMNKAQTPGTPEMMIPFVSGRRKFIMPNIDVTNKQERTKLMEDLKEETEEQQLTKDTTEGSTGRKSQGNVIILPNTKDARKPDNPTVNKQVNEIVQYNPKSIQLTVLNREENTGIPKEPTTALEIAVPNTSPRQNKVALKPQSELKDTGDTIKQSQEVNTDNSVQLYGPKHSQRELTSLADSNSENRAKNQNFIFIWFPEEIKAFKEQKRAPNIQIQGDNVSSDQIPERTADSEEAILVKGPQRYTGKSTNRISTDSSKPPHVTQKEEQKNETPSSEQ